MIYLLMNKFGYLGNRFFSFFAFAFALFWLGSIQVQFLKLYNSFSRSIIFYGIEMESGILTTVCNSVKVPGQEGTG